MILEGFEIENWSCIKRMTVDDLPQSGVVVLHGPNGTGKSSAIEALRACLMDKKSTSRALDRGFPKNSAEKPRVRVTFRARGGSWRITKQFNSRESRLESRTPSGKWKLETSEPKEAYDRARELCGGCDSSLGLHQLLWLTQAEYRLPDPKEFDADVQSRLRAVLGVLQTPLDDHFLGRVKEEWSRWFSARNKPGERPKLKSGSSLEKDLNLLRIRKAELEGVELEYREFEEMIERSRRLEISARDLRRQLEEKTNLRERLQHEYAECRARLEAHRYAVENMKRAEAAIGDARSKKEHRAEVEMKIRDEEASEVAAHREVEETAGRLRAADESLRGLRRELQRLVAAGRELQERLNEVGDKRALIGLSEQLVAARDKLRRAEESDARFEELKRQTRERPSPDGSTIKKLEDNRAKAARFRADLDAATIALTLLPDADAVTIDLAIDGARAEGVSPPPDRSPVRYSIRRRAEITIPGWGRAEVLRGADARSLDQIEDDLNFLDRQFDESLAAFGLASSNPNALDLLRVATAEAKLRESELRRRNEELVGLAPHGLDALRDEAEDFSRRLKANAASLESGSLRDPLEQDVVLLDAKACELKGEIQKNKAEVALIGAKIQDLETQIDGESLSNPALGKGCERAVDVETLAQSLRQREWSARERLTSLVARLEVLRDDLGRIPTMEQISGDLRAAEVALNKAREEVDSTRLSESEQTVRERLDAANEGWRSLEGRRSAAERELHELKGALSQSEGLHQKRAAAAARVEEFTRRTERESLESDAYDRLYALFEECREKQLGAIMGPIHDRVLRWMRLLRIGGYHRIHFNDQFLPERLIAGDGAVELSLAEESTGTIEQIALMVRLALGSSLSTSEEPVVAVLDDPLTHSDLERLELMRAVLKSAAVGDSRATPPSGPMQILVFTCHPEWFTTDGARIIDLSKSDTLIESD